MKANPLIQRLREEGGRATPVRKTLMKAFSESGKPLCVLGLNRLLAKEGLRPNKTTLYREIRFMVERGWVRELDFGVGHKCYEWSEEHHHHLVCRKCNRIEELDAHEMESSFARFEKCLGRKTGFADLSHSLEFYGLCKQCQ